MLLRLLSAATLLLLPVVAVSPPLPLGNHGAPEVCKTICIDLANNCVKEYCACSPDPKCTGGTGEATSTPSQCQDYYNMKLPKRHAVAPPGPNTPQQNTYVVAPHGPKVPNPNLPQTGGNPNLPQTGANPSCDTICLEYMNDCRKTNGGCFPDPTCTGGADSGTFVPPPCPGTKVPDMKDPNAEGLRGGGGNEDCPDEGCPDEDPTKGDEDCPDEDPTKGDEDCPEEDPKAGDEDCPDEDGPTADLKAPYPAGVGPRGAVWYPKKTTAGMPRYQTESPTKGKCNKSEMAKGKGKGKKVTMMVTVTKTVRVPGC